MALLTLETWKGLLAGWGLSEMGFVTAATNASGYLLRVAFIQH
jgi:hypothetical protein